MALTSFNLAHCRGSRLRSGHVFAILIRGKGQNFCKRRHFCIDNMAMASARLRKAFKYPTDDESEPDELDEEHQEKLIAALQAEDAQKNELYRKAFLAIPVAGGAVFIYTVLFESTTAQQRLIAVLSLFSLACTAYILHFMPLRAPERKGKKPVYQVDAEKGPLERYLIYLNGALAALLLVTSMVSWRKGDGGTAWRQALPAIIYGLTMVVRQQLAPMDFEDLQKAKYNYKGA